MARGNRSPLNRNKEPYYVYPTLSFFDQGHAGAGPAIGGPGDGELLVSLLQQGFVVGLLQVWAGSAEQALACYERAAQQQAFADALSGSLPELAGVSV